MKELDEKKVKKDFDIIVRTKYKDIKDRLVVRIKYNNS